MTNLEYCNEILSIIGNVTEANDAIYNLAFDAYQKLGGQETQPSLATIYNELKSAIQIWDNTDSLNITENGTYNLLGKIITVNVQCSGSIPANSEIWYTSTDGNIVTPHSTSALPTIVSNTYSGDKGIIKCASDITRIGDLAFKGCTTLTSVTIPNSVTRIGEFAFESCGGLSLVIIPNNVTSIGKQAFYKCTGLTSVSIPNKVTSIGNDAFYDCRALTSVTIPDSVESIGNDAFRNCSGLTSVAIPNSVTSIGQGAFQNCNKLTDVSIGNSVISIREMTFNNCDSLASVIIGNSVKSIEKFAFGYCRSLRNISYEDTITRWNDITKVARWNQDVPATVVHCSDGDTPI